MDKIKSINIYFGKKDQELFRWACSVPRGLFSYYVREAIRSYINKKKDFVLPQFHTENNTATEKKYIVKPVSVSYNTPEEKEVYDYIFSLENSFRSFGIKQILKKYLGGNEKKENISIEKNTPSNTKAAKSKEVPEITKMIKSSIIRSRK